MGRRVHLEQPIHEEAWALLRENAEVSVGYGPEARELDDALLAEVNALLVRTKPLGAEEIGKAHQLRVIARHGVGVDNVAVEAATRRGVPVLITPRANLRSVVEHVFALALAVSRNLVRADRYVREGRFAERDSLATLASRACGEASAADARQLLDDLCAGLLGVGDADALVCGQL